MEVRKEEISNNAQPALEAEVRKLKGLNDFYEGQIKDAQARQREQEVKLQAALKNQKKDTATEEASGKGRTGQLENNIRKLTQDLVESRNLMAEMKKETTKLRQEKIAFQNQIDKFKKDAEKAKGAAPKKPGAGGKAA
jgi:chromosome segregation ATPase